MMWFTTVSGTMRSQRHSLWLLVAVVFCLFGVSGAAFYPLAFPPLDDGGTLETKAPLWYLAYTYLYILVAMAVILPNLTRIFYVFFDNKLLSALMSYMLLSSMWALDPSVTFQEAIKNIIVVALAFYMVLEFSSRDLLKIFAVLMMLLIVSSYIFSVFLPDIGMHESGEWRGAFTHKNQLVIRMNIAFIVLALTALYIPEWKWASIVAAVGAALLIILSQSGTGIIILTLIIISPFLLPLFRLHSSLFISLCVAGVCVVCILFAMFDMSEIINSFFKMLGKNPTLTGRVDTWTGALFSFLDYRNSNLFLGYGVQSLYYTSYGQLIAVRVPNSLTIDSAYVNVLLRYGLIGAVLFAAVMVKGFKIALRQLHQNVSMLGKCYIVIMVVIMVNGISENTDEIKFLWLFLALLFASPYIRETYVTPSANRGAYA